jgi:hypothetical protein
MHSRNLGDRFALVAAAVALAGLALALLQLGLARAAGGATDAIILQPLTPTAQSGAPGSTVTYTVRVTSTDSILTPVTMTLSGNSWPSQIAFPADGRAPWLPKDVTIEVSIPYTAVGTDLVTFTVVPWYYPADTASMLLATTVERKFFLPSVGR